MLDKKPPQPHHAVMLDKVPKSASARTPQRSIRFRSKQELETLKRAARQLNMSLNTFVAESALRAAEATLKSRNSGNREEDLRASA